MALIAKMQSVYSPPSAMSAHAVEDARYAASTDGPVEGLNAARGASFEGAVTAGERESQGRYGQGRQGRVTQPLVRMIVNAPTQAFAALIEFQAQTGIQSEAKARGASSFLSKAIAIYEGNARVISGTNNPPGGALSLSL